MKADIKKYVRTNEGEITTLGEYYIKNKIPEDEHYFEVEYLLEFESIIKVANTPMELLQDEDLIRYKMYIGSDRVVTKSIPLAVCGNMENEVMIYVGSMLIPHDWITDILTPNQNSGYDLQYSKEGK